MKRLCCDCIALRAALTVERQVVTRLQQQLDAERRHGAELERAHNRHRPTWAPDAKEPA